jgi:hypothetical protein
MLTKKCGVFGMAYLFTKEEGSLFAWIVMLRYPKP